MNVVFLLALLGLLFKIGNSCISKEKYIPVPVLISSLFLRLRDATVCKIDRTNIVANLKPGKILGTVRTGSNFVVLYISYRKGNAD